MNNSTLVVVSTREPRRYTTRELIILVNHTRANPDAWYQVSWTSVLSAREVRAWFVSCLHRKIDRDTTRVGRCWTWEYQRDQEHDTQLVRDHYQNRTRHSGRNLLRTPVCKRRYPDIDSPESEW